MTYAFAPNGATEPPIAVGSERSVKAAAERHVGHSDYPGADHSLRDLLRAGALDQTQFRPAATIQTGPRDGALVGTSAEWIDEIWTVTETYEEAPIDDAFRSALIARLNDHAETVRLRYITPGDGKAMTYQRKAAEAIAVKADVSPTLETYPVLAVSIGTEVPDTDDVEADLNAIADIVIAKQAQWAALAAAIEANVLTAKGAIEGAASRAAANAIIEALVWPGDGPVE